MQEGRVVEISSSLAIEASNQSISNGLKLADSIIYATAMMHNAIVWTCDSDFKDLPGVRYFDKR
jgi:predicted nucleic acid-binding protein